MGNSYWKMKCIIYFYMSILRPVCSSVPLLFWILLHSLQTAVILVLVMEFYTCLNQHTPSKRKRSYRCVCVCWFRSHSLLYFWWHWFCSFHFLFCISGCCTCFSPLYKQEQTFGKKKRTKSKVCICIYTCLNNYK